MSLNVDLFWSFRSPYSYLVTQRLVDLNQEYDLTFAVRPVYPLAIRDRDFFKKANPLIIEYIMRDSRRVAKYLELPFVWPDPDPVVFDRDKKERADEQPYIHRLTRLGVVAAAQGKGLPFIDEVSKLLFGSGIKGWDGGDHLAEAARRASVDLTELDALIARAPEKHDAIIEENQLALTEAGHWGVPTMVFQGEPFFGQDRVDLLLWRLRQHGLRRR